MFLHNLKDEASDLCSKRSRSSRSSKSLDQFWVRPKCFDLSHRFPSASVLFTVLISRFCPHSCVCCFPFLLSSSRKVKPLYREILIHFGGRSEGRVIKLRISAATFTHGPMTNHTSCRNRSSLNDHSAIHSAPCAGNHAYVPFSIIRWDIHKICPCLFRLVAFHESASTALSISPTSSPTSAMKGRQVARIGVASFAQRSAALPCSFHHLRHITTSTSTSKRQRSSLSLNGTSTSPYTMSSSNGTSTGRNIVLCLDGTKNQFSSTNSNLIKLFSILQVNDNQLVYYDSGVGTDLGAGQSWWTGFKRWLALTADLAFAWYA